MNELLEDCEIPGMDEATPKHGFELDVLRRPSGNPWYIYLRDPSLPPDEIGRSRCVGTVILSAGPKTWQWWVDGYLYRDSRCRGQADGIDDAAEQAWAAWQAAPGRHALVTSQKGAR